MRCTSRILDCVPEGRSGSSEMVGERQSSEYTCFFCCHVRMGAVFLGVFNLIKDLLAVTIITALTLHPDLAQGQSNVFSTYLGLANDVNQTSSTNVTQPNWVIENTWDCDDKFLGLLLTVGSSILTVSLLYGVISARPRYILPFFWLQMFDFCITCLTFIGYFSYGPDIKRWLAAQKSFPLRDELLTLGSEWLMAITALLALVIIWTKAYCIRVVWYCYKYLIFRLSGAIIPQSADSPIVVGDDCIAVGHADIQESQMILPPKYEDLTPIVGSDISASFAPPAYDSLVLHVESESSTRADK